VTRTRRIGCATIRQLRKPAGFSHAGSEMPSPIPALARTAAPAPKPQRRTHHLRAVPDEHLHQLRPRQLQKRGVGLRGARAREERLARPGGPVEQHALGGPDAQLDEALLVLDGEHHRLDELLDLGWGWRWGWRWGWVGGSGGVGWGSGGGEGGVKRALVTDPALTRQKPMPSPHTHKGPQADTQHTHTHPSYLLVQPPDV